MDYKPIPGASAGSSRNSLELKHRGGGTPKIAERRRAQYALAKFL